MKTIQGTVLLIAAVVGFSPVATAVEPAAALQLQWLFGANHAPQADINLGFVAQARPFGASHTVPALGLTGLSWQHGLGPLPVVLGVTPSHLQALHANDNNEGKRAKWPWITAVSVVGGIALVSLVDSSDDNSNNDGTSNSEEPCNIVSGEDIGSVTVISGDCGP